MSISSSSTPPALSSTQAFTVHTSHSSITDYSSSDFGATRRDEEGSSSSVTATQRFEQEHAELVAQGLTDDDEGSSTVSPHSHHCEYSQYAQHPPPPPEGVEVQGFQHQYQQQVRAQHIENGYREMVEREEKLDAEAAQHNSIIQSSILTPQDYIPRKLVGYEYGEKEWQLKKSPFPLLDKQSYLRIGTNGVFSIRPSVIYFGGFHLGNKYTQTVSIVNTSTFSQRLHILPIEDSAASSSSSSSSSASSNCFRIKYNKKGLIAPGMAESVQIIFEPLSYKYVNKNIKINCIGENLIIPIHAYPILNLRNHIFPSQIDMGRCQVGRRISKRFELISDVPIQFEYDLRILNPSMEFAIFPLRGIIPAQGSAWITIDYLPKRPTTSQIQIQVNISQFKFQPFVCTICGDAKIYPLPMIKIVNKEQEERLKLIKQKKQKIELMFGNQSQQQKAFNKLTLQQQNLKQPTTAANQSTKS